MMMFDCRAGSHRSWLALSAAVSVACHLASLAPAAAQQFKVPFAAYQYMFDQINAFRKENGLPRLKAHFGAGTIAEQYATWLGQNNKAGHYDDGLGPQGRMDAYNRTQRKPVRYCSILENIHHSWTTGSAEPWKSAIDKAMTFWKNSPGHRQAMLSASNVIGQGIVGWQHGNKYYYKEVVVIMENQTCR